MAQVQGSESRLLIMPEATFNTAPAEVIHSCEAAWDELVDADVTATADATVYKVGTKSCKLVAGAGLGAGDIMATDNFTAKDLSSYTHVGMWVRSTVALAAGDLALLLTIPRSAPLP